MTNELNQDRIVSEPAHRALRLLFAGGHVLGIFVDEIDTIVDWRPPTPLPNAPASVLGIVGIRGRMLTVLQTITLFEENAVAEPRLIVALRGDEQLALAVDRVGETMSVNLDQLETGKLNSALLGGITHGSTHVSVLNSAQLFATAIRGHERRRRRF